MTPTAGLPTTQQNILARVEQFAESVLTPRANAVDQMPLVPLKSFQALGAAGLLGISIPTEFGGLDVPRSLRRTIYETLAAACGVTAFTLNQHYSAGAMIASSENNALKAAMLPALASGERLAGVAFSHIRRPGPPQMRVEPDGDGWRFTGSAPWATGYGLYQDVALAGTLPNGNLLFALVPFRPEPGLSFSEPMRLVAMSASGTVTASADNYYVAPAQWIRTWTPEQLRESDMQAVLGNTSLSYAASRAARRILATVIRDRPTPDTEATLVRLDAESDRLHAILGTLDLRTGAADYYASALRLRAECIAHAVDAALSAAVATGGSAAMLDNSAQRVYREAMFSALTAQTPDVKASTLRRLGGEQ